MEGRDAMSSCNRIDLLCFCIFENLTLFQQFLDNKDIILWFFSPKDGENLQAFCLSRKWNSFIDNDNDFILKNDACWAGAKALVASAERGYPPTTAQLPLIDNSHEAICRHEMKKLKL